MLELSNPNSYISLLSREELLELWSKLLTLRIFEEKVSEYYHKKQMKTPTHLGIGQEAISVGVAWHKKKGDKFFSHHRSHNAYLASGGNIRGLVDELHGLSTGCSAGNGGSVHLIDQEAGFMGSFAILGETAAIATGSALGHKLKKEKNVSFAFFGDAALEEGSLWEAINFSAIFELPIVFICENNSYSTESHIMNRTKLGTSFTTKVSSFGIMAERIYGQELFEVIVKSKALINYCREYSRPVFLEFETKRFYEHVGPFRDFDNEKKFRDFAEQQISFLHDPLRFLFESLVKTFSIDTNVLLKIQDSKIQEIDAYFLEAGDSKARPKPESLLENVF